MCGIFGIVTKENQNLGPILVGAGERLSYRGYDTVGAATIPQEGKIDLRKDAGRVQEVAEKGNPPAAMGYIWSPLKVKLPTTS